MRPNTDGQRDETPGPLVLALRSRATGKAIERLSPSLAVMVGPHDNPGQTALAIVALYLFGPIAKALGVGLARRIEAVLRLSRLPNDPES